MKIILFKALLHCSIKIKSWRPFLFHNGLLLNSANTSSTSWHFKTFTVASIGHTLIQALRNKIKTYCSLQLQMCSANFLSAKFILQLELFVWHVRIYSITCVSLLLRKITLNRQIFIWSPALSKSLNLRSCN